MFCPNSFSYHTTVSLRKAFISESLKKVPHSSPLFPNFQSSFYLNKHNLLFIGCQFGQFIIANAENLEIIQVVSIDESKYGSAMGTNIENFFYIEKNEIILVCSEKGVYAYRTIGPYEQAFFQKNWFGYSIAGFFALPQTDRFFIFLQRGLEGLLEERQIETPPNIIRKQENLLCYFPTFISENCLGFISGENSLYTMGINSLQKKSASHHMRNMLEDRKSGV